MKLNFAGNEVDVKLTCKSMPYNCGTKLIGRLTTVWGSGGPGRWIGQDKEVILDNNKEALIKEFIAWLGMPSSHPPLSLGGHNPFFPTDGGLYPVSLLLYADAANKHGYKWWSDMQALITEELTKPMYGCTIQSMLKYHNKVYGTNRPSCLWGIFLPTSKDSLISFKEAS
jgi:hypothetical protein